MVICKQQLLFCNESITAACCYFLFEVSCTITKAKERSHLFIMASASDLLALAREGNIGALEDLLKENKVKSCINDRVETNGSHTPLTAACWFGQLDSVKTLLRNGADPNVAGGEDNMSALHVAATFGKKSIVEYLLDNCPTGKRTH